MPSSNPNPPGETSPRNHWLVRYGFALLAIVAALLLREALTRLTGGGLPTYITLYPAVMVSALFGGIGPGLLATGVAALGADYFLLSPLGSLAVATLSDAVGLAFFSGMGVFMSAVAENYRRARQRTAVQDPETVLRADREIPARRSTQGLTEAEAKMRHHRDHLTELVAARTEALSRSNAQLNLALTSSGMATFDWDIVRDQRQWSHGVHALLGTKPESFTGTAEEFFRIIHPEDRSAVQAALAGAVEQTGVYETEYRAVWPDGSIRHIAARGKVHFDTAGRAVLMTGICWDITERKQAQEASARLAAIVESSDDAILSKDLEGNITSWNVGAERLFGYRLEEVLGRPIGLLLPPERQHEETGIMARLLAGDRVNHFETVRLTKAGRSLAVSVTISPVKDAGGRIIGASKIVRDITERRQSEATLRRLNRMLRALGRSSQAMLHATDETDYLQAVCQDVQECGHAMVWVGMAKNDEVKSILPVAHAGLDTGYLETLHLTWADTERGRGPTGTAIRTGAPAICQDMRTNAQFSPWREEALKRGYASSLVLPLADAGKTFGAVTIYSRQPNDFPPDEVQLLTELAGDLAHGITKLRAEAQMRVQAAALQAAANGIAITDRAGTIQWVNPAFTQLTGYSAAEAVGQNPRLLKSGAHPPEFYAHLWQTILAGRVWHDEIVNQRKDGTCYTEEMTITPVTAAGGAIHSFIAIKQDVTGRKQVEAALAQARAELERQNRELEQRVAERTSSLQQALAEMEQFTYVASHDLQEPLRAVSSFSQLLARRYQGKLDADADEFIAFVVEAATRMQTLINDLLALSRVGTRGNPFAPVAGGEILQVVKENLDVAIAESGAVITHDPLPTLAADRTQLTQLFQNLFSNAIKFRRPAEAPRIHVSATREDRGWRFCVRDNGLGIDPRYFERIFIVFQRLHNRDEYPGTGIGLAICKKIVERHGGRLWVESEPGNGSTFQFTIPDAN